MLENEKQLLANLDKLCKDLKLSRDDHEYLKDGIKYLADRLEELNKLKPIGDKIKE